MFFCPFCGTLLVVENTGSNGLVCHACAYVLPVTQTLTVTHDFSSHNKKGAGDEELLAHSGAGGDEGQIMTIRCASDAGECTNDKAVYSQVQMRGGDEAQTTFFRCTSCGFQWRQD